MTGFALEESLLISIGGVIMRLITVLSYVKVELIILLSIYTAKQAAVVLAALHWYPTLFLWQMQVKPLRVLSLPKDQ